MGQNLGNFNYVPFFNSEDAYKACLLYACDAADERPSIGVDDFSIVPK